MGPIMEVSLGNKLIENSALISSKSLMTPLALLRLILQFRFKLAKIFADFSNHHTGCSRCVSAVGLGSRSFTSTKCKKAAFPVIKRISLGRGLSPVDFYDFWVLIANGNVSGRFHKVCNLC
ncbi:hypothetical protein MKW98_016681 [Papaver atlanticum]|uniref:Uncharacterized protein n=1 Tax=Papaver atlanticum TaxID=357466 RepID=A0AAD4SR71_9MAGN|nr:hypothetical protein MKW98_016681 [Papaver atlanticum]